MTIARWGQADIPDEMLVGQNWSILNNFSETMAKAKGKRVEDQIIHWFRGDEHDSDTPCEFEVPLNVDVIEERVNASPRHSRSTSSMSEPGSTTSQRPDATADGSEVADDDVAAPDPPPGWGGAEP